MIKCCVSLQITLKYLFRESLANIKDVLLISRCVTWNLKVTAQLNLEEHTRPTIKHSLNICAVKSRTNNNANVSNYLLFPPFHHLGSNVYSIRVHAVATPATLKLCLYSIDGLLCPYWLLHAVLPFHHTVSVLTRSSPASDQLPSSYAMLSA